MGLRRRHFIIKLGVSHFLFFATLYFDFFSVQQKIQRHFATINPEKQKKLFKSYVMYIFCLQNAQRKNGNNYKKKNQVFDWFDRSLFNKHQMRLEFVEFLYELPLSPSEEEVLVDVLVNSIPNDKGLWHFWHLTLLTPSIPTQILPFATTQGLHYLVLFYIQRNNVENAISVFNMLKERQMRQQNGENNMELDSNVWSCDLFLIVLTATNIHPQKKNLAEHLERAWTAPHQRFTNNHTFRMPDKYIRAPETQ